MAEHVFYIFFIGLFIFLQNAIVSEAKRTRHGLSRMETLDDLQGRIVGGYNTTIQDYPYQAYLLVEVKKKYYQCGGSIISNRYILTAAHCLTGANAVYVRTGSTNSDSGGHLYYTTSYKIHPKYLGNDYDIAYVDLKKYIPLDGIKEKAVKLVEENKAVKPGTEIVITGWGDTTEGGSASETLNAVKVPTVSTEQCRKSYSSITAQMFCAGNPEGGKDSCQGDSGGPAVTTSDGVQIGVVSFGVGCARPGIPGVYTNIAAVRSWIRQNTGV